jgi:hypothetical protein
MKKGFIAVTLFIFIYTHAFQQVKQDIPLKWDENIESVLRESGKNRTELEKALNYFRQNGDSLKYKAICFLIEDIDIHYSMSYYWADTLNQPVAFSELNYATFEESHKAFEELKKKTPGIHPVPVKYRDIDSIKGDFLIDNVERAFEVWKRPWAKDLPFDMFCEYLLPYRMSIEPLQQWRQKYYEKFSWITDSAFHSPVLEAANYLKEDILQWFFNTYNIETRKEPLPRLGPMQLLHRKKGPCEDIAGLAAYAMRSQGIPATEDIAVYWGTSSGSHFWNVTFDKGDALPVDINTHGNGKFSLIREPAKVIRLTWSKQPGTIASLLPANQIPDGFMQVPNYTDVTDIYWPTGDVVCDLFNSNIPSGYVFACVFNYLQWKPAWWGRVKDGKTIFHQMSKGVVYLPMCFYQEKLFPAGYPVALYKDSCQKILVPDTINKRAITLDEQDNYLIYQPGKSYKLYYWDNNWKLLKGETADFDHKLVFESVPGNALLLLVPEYSKRKERPFTINEKGEREWW